MSRRIILVQEQFFYSSGSVLRSPITHVENNIDQPFDFSAIVRMFGRRYFHTISLTFKTLQGQLLKSHGRPTRFSSSTPARPSRNRLHHLKTLGCEKTVSLPDTCQHTKTFGNRFLEFHLKFEIHTLYEVTLNDVHM